MEIRAPRGNKLTCKSWQTEAAMRMLMNNLDPEVAKDPANLIVYGVVTGTASTRSWKPLRPWKRMKHFWCKAENL